MSNRKWQKIIIPFIGLALICTLILSIFDNFTREKIANNARRYQLPILDALMPLDYDNELYSDVIKVSEPGFLGSENNISIFRARKNNEPVGLVILPIVTKGYSGLIKLAVGIAKDGTLLSVQIIEHQETEGLGDGIDQNKSDWILQFSGRSLKDTPLNAWAVESEGGQFDQLSGATISSRTVINAVRKTLDYHEINNDRLYLE